MAFGGGLGAFGASVLNRFGQLAQQGRQTTIRKSGRGFRPSRTTRSARPSRRRSLGRSGGNSLLPSLPGRETGRNQFGFPITTRPGTNLLAGSGAGGGIDPITGGLTQGVSDARRGSNIERDRLGLPDNRTIGDLPEATISNSINNELGVSPGLINNQIQDISRPSPSIDPALGALGGVADPSPSFFNIDSGGLKGGPIMKGTAPTSGGGFGFTGNPFASIKQTPVKRSFLRR